MKNIRIKIGIFSLLIISAFAWWILACIQNLGELSLFELLKLIPNVVTIDLVVTLIFINWGWKLRIFKGWLVPYPNLNGSWLGHIESTYINPDTNERIPSIPVLLTIKQTFLKISCVMRTNEMVSYSYISTFKIDPDNQIKQLCYSYTSKPFLTVTERSPAHDGTIIFDIIEQNNITLKGQYWTSRKTTGEINLKFREKTLLSKLPEDI